MSELKPTDKGYIEASAEMKEKIQTLELELEKAKESSKKWCNKAMQKHNEFLQFKTKVALEHNNVPELIEAVKELVYELTGEQQNEQELEKGLGIRLCSLTLRAKNMVTKAEQNKLNK